MRSFLTINVQAKVALQGGLRRGGSGLSKPIKDGQEKKIAEQAATSFDSSRYTCLNAVKNSFKA